jgi:pimeloyl-ACP methyl ester carboxylesterase
MDRWLQLLAGITTPKNLARFVRLRALALRMGSLVNPKRVAHDEMLWLLQRGGEKEPRKVVEQFARWIRDGQMRCERTGFDYQRGFKDIDVPLAILYGDRDRLASRDSTGVVARAAGSEYKLWRSVAENSHLELTMGADVRHCCEAIRELVLFARSRRSSLPARPAMALRALALEASP